MSPFLCTSPEAGVEFISSHHSSPVTFGALEILCSAEWIDGRLLTASAPLSSNATRNHSGLCAETEPCLTGVNDASLEMAIFIDAVKPVLSLGHEGGVRDHVTHIGSVLVVEDRSLLFSWHLDTLVC